MTTDGELSAEEQKVVRHYVYNEVVRADTVRLLSKLKPDVYFPAKIVPEGVTVFINVPLNPKNTNDQSLLHKRILDRKKSIFSNDVTKYLGKSQTMSLEKYMKNVLQLNWSDDKIRDTAALLREEAFPTYEMVWCQTEKDWFDMHDDNIGTCMSTNMGAYREYTNKFDREAVKLGYWCSFFYYWCPNITGAFLKNNKGEVIARTLMKCEPGNKEAPVGFMYTYAKGSGKSILEGKIREKVRKDLQNTAYQLPEFEIPAYEILGNQVAPFPRCNCFSYVNFMYDDGKFHVAPGGVHSPYPYKYCSWIDQYGNKPQIKKGK